MCGGPEACTRSISCSLRRDLGWAGTPHPGHTLSSSWTKQGTFMLLTTSGGIITQFRKWDFTLLGQASYRQGHLYSILWVLKSPFCLQWLVNTGHYCSLRWPQSATFIKIQEFTTATLWDLKVLCLLAAQNGYWWAGNLGNISVETFPTLHITVLLSQAGWASQLTKIQPLD